MTERSLSLHEIEISSLALSKSSSRKRRPKNQQRDNDGDDDETTEGSLLGDGHLSWSFSESTLPASRTSSSASALERSATLRTKYSLETPSLFSSNLTISGEDERGVSQRHDDFDKHDDDDDSDGRHHPLTSRRKKLLAFLVGLLSNLVSGLIYAIPLYSQWMTNDLKLTKDDVALLGNLSQAALGLMTLPLGMIHAVLSRTSTNDKRADLVVSMITGVAQAGGLALVVISTSSSSSSSLSSSALASLMAIGLICNGGATAGIFSHAMWVSGHNYSDNTRVRRVVVVSISLALGLGAALWVCLLSFVHMGSPWDILLLHAILSAVTAVLRGLFMFRLFRGEADETDTKKKWSTKRKNRKGRPKEVGIWKQLGQSFTSYFCSGYLTWVFFINLMIASGLSACILSISGNVLITALDEGEATLAGKISTATMTLLGCQALGRLLVLALQNLSKADFNHWYFVIGNLMNVIAFTLLWGTGGVTFKLFVVSSVFSGLSFGVTWACWPVGVYNHFPGKLSKVQTNMGITFLAIFLGGLLVHFMSEGVLHLKQGHDCKVVETVAGQNTYRGSQCYEQVFAMFIILAMISVALSVVAAILIQRRLFKTSS